MKKVFSQNVSKAIFLKLNIKNIFLNLLSIEVLCTLEQYKNFCHVLFVSIVSHNTSKKHLNIHLGCFKKLLNKLFLVISRTYFGSWKTVICSEE